MRLFLYDATVQLVQTSDGIEVDIVGVTMKGTDVTDPDLPRVEVGAVLTKELAVKLMDGLRQALDALG